MRRLLPLLALTLSACAMQPEQWPLAQGRWAIPIITFWRIHF